MEESIYKWKNSGVLDVTIPKRGKSLVRELLNFKCKKCDSIIIADNNDDIIDQIHNKDLNGAFITCNNCKSEFYIHFPHENINMIEADIKSIDF